MTGLRQQIALPRVARSPGSRKRAETRQSRVTDVRVVEVPVDDEGDPARIDPCGFRSSCRGPAPPRRGWSRDSSSVSRLVRRRWPLAPSSALSSTSPNRHRRTPCGSEPLTPASSLLVPVPSARHRPQRTVCGSEPQSLSCDHRPRGPKRSSGTSVSSLSSRASSRKRHQAGALPAGPKRVAEASRSTARGSLRDSRTGRSPRARGCSGSARARGAPRRRSASSQLGQPGVQAAPGHAQTAEDHGQNPFARATGRPPGRGGGRRGPRTPTSGQRHRISSFASALPRRSAT